MKERSKIVALLSHAFSADRGVQLVPALAVLTILSLFIIPLAPGFLDVLIVTNIFVALLLLLRALYLEKTITLSSFPAIILITTLFRLALNVSSTRLILLDGANTSFAAGEVIEAFGSYVVRGDFLVGCMVFVAIALVNFIVITKGSARVAEVAARFVLDALPGKQLAIDAEQRSGACSVEEARRKREELERESQFFGAMDGSMKFVQGDAIAGFLITSINFLGGVGIGVYRGMPLGEAFQRFGILTIGDGLVSIVPALLISICAGLVVTRVSSDVAKSTGIEVATQIFAQRNVVFGAGTVLLTVSVASGLPILPTAIVVGLILLAQVVGLRQAGLLSFEGGLVNSILRLTSSSFDVHTSAIETARGLPRVLLPQGKGEVSYSGLRPLVLEIDAASLSPRLQSSKSQRDIRSRIEQIRRELYVTRGLIMPEVAIAASKDLPSNYFRVLIRERVYRSGKIEPDTYCLAMNRSGVQSMGLRCVSTSTHPRDGRSICWVDTKEDDLRALKHIGISVYSASEYLLEEAYGAASEAFDELFGLDEVKLLVAELSKHHYPLVEEVFHKGLLTYSECTEMLRRLVRERVNVYDLKLVLEGVVEFSSLDREVDSRSEWLEELHEYLRIVLSRQIVSMLLNPGDTLRTFMLSEEIESEFRSVRALWDGYKSQPPIEPGLAEALRDKLRKTFAPVVERGALPVVIICGADVRPLLHEFIVSSSLNPEWIRTLSFEELGGKYQPESIGVLGV